MKKNLILCFLLLLFLLFPSMFPKALRPYEVEAHFKENCPIIELATAKEDGTLEKVECYENYNDAKTILNTTDNDNLVIIENGIIIDAKYAVVDYDVSFANIKTGYIDIYVSNTSNDTNGGYIRTAGTYADDAVMLDYDYNTKRVKIKVAGVIGWINKYYDSSLLYDIVPLAWVKSPQYYSISYNNVIKQDELVHHMPKNVYDSNVSEYTYKIDLKPNFMVQNQKYYSYDGHYFYNSMKELIQDYKNNNYNQSINKDNPYYNYYQYLSFRTKTNYNIDNINQYLASRTTEASKLRNTGETFIWTQDNYGINAIIMMAIGINESGHGTSTIAKEKNNLFGLNAVDATPGESANYFPSVEECIKTYGYTWLSYGYVKPGDYRFKGANLGNKIEGLNYKYASDPFWGEKAASFYYDIDKTYGFQDRNTNTLAVLNNDYNDTVYAKKSIDGVNISSDYQYRVKDSVIVVLEEIKINNTTWYKIQSDPNLNESLDYIGNSKSNPRINYNWNGFVYIRADYFNIIYRKSEENNQKEVIIDDTKKDNNNEEEKKEEGPIIVYKEISSIIIEANYLVTNNMISKITLNTTVDEIRNNLLNNGATDVALTDINNNSKTGKLSTGDKIYINNGEKIETFDVVIYGDTSGDGEISAVDYVKIKNHIMETSKLFGVYEKAADFNNDNNVSASDYVKVKNYIMEQ